MERKSIMKTKLKQFTAVLVTVFFAAVSLAVPAAAASKIAAPKNLKVTAKTQTSVSLSWDKVESAAKYFVYYSIDKKEITEYGSAKSTTATVKKLKSDQKYYFYVRAVDKNGVKSSYSKAVSASTKSAENKSTKLRITQEAGTVGNNDIAILKAVGKPDTTYTLKVYYSSKVSEAKGTGAKKSDANGNVTWSWKVGAKTKPGTHKIVIEGGGDKIETTFETVE